MKSNDKKAFLNREYKSKEININLLMLKENYNKSIDLRYNTIKQLIEDIDINKLTYLNKINLIKKYSKDMYNICKELEEEGCKIFNKAIGDIKLHWYSDMYNKNIYEIINETYDMNDIFVMDEDINNRYFKYNSERCLLIKNIENKEDVDIFNIIMNSPIKVNNGIDDIYLTVKDIYITSEKLPEELLVNEKYKNLKRLILEQYTEEKVYKDDISFSD